MNAQLDIAKANSDYRREVLTRSYAGHHDGWFHLPSFLRTHAGR